MKKGYSELEAQLRGDVDFLKAVQSAQSLEELMSTLKGENYDISPAELLRHSSARTLELSDEELESATGGVSPISVFFIVQLPWIVTGGVVGGGAGAVAATTATIC
jgi:predicted ribosomally synthesized peptide with nif11-like leader